MPLNVGAHAPDFALADGRRLSSFAGDKVVVLYFYPKDFTPG